MKQVSYIMATVVRQKCTPDVHDVIHNDIKGIILINLISSQIKCYDRCQRMQPVLQSHAPDLHPVPVAADVWSLVGMDLIGPFAVISQGNPYVLTLTYYFSKWVEAYPIPYKSTISVALGLYKAYVSTRSTKQHHH